MAAQSAALETRDPSTLSPHPKNEELYGEEQLPVDFVESIDRHGIREPLVITDEDRIVSGHRRWQASKELGLERVPVMVESYDSELDEWEALVDFNRQRKKTPAQIVNEAELLMDVERKRAEQRQKAQLKQGDDQPDRVELPEREKGRARDKAGEQLGYSGSTIERGLRVKQEAESGDDTAREEWEKMERDEQSIHGAYDRVRESRDDQPETDDEPEPERAGHTCPVCGEQWYEREWLSNREGETIPVESICVVDWPETFVLHFAEDERP